MLFANSIVCFIQVELGFLQSENIEETQHPLGNDNYVYGVLDGNIFFRNRLVIKRCREVWSSHNIRMNGFCGTLDCDVAY